MNVQRSRSAGRQMRPEFGERDRSVTQCGETQVDPFPFSPVAPTDPIKAQNAKAVRFTLEDDLRETECGKSLIP